MPRGGPAVSGRKLLLLFPYYPRQSSSHEHNAQTDDAVLPTPATVKSQ